MVPSVRRVFVVGVGMTKFEKPGARENFDYPDMAKEAGQKALSDAGISYSDVKQACVGYVYGDSTCGQCAIYHSLGMTGIPIINVNNNCSTGSTALFMARQLILGADFQHMQNAMEELNSIAKNITVFEMQMILFENKMLML
ncbi:sterol carrier protein 2-like [Protopterus annectens]|uniref:sterol carrier protein 2-like n=1 Tax=Protopterus annectens TaxID=7888 RepID=UPI001CFC08D1|nr:sterol carrier protein 2-like [Protopterus annectens]